MRSSTPIGCRRRRLAGEWATPSGAAAATGALLRRRYPSDVFSVGFFMGHGSVANNSRAARPMNQPPPASIESAVARTGHAVAFLDLARHARWGDAMHPCLRNGLAVDSMRPRREFDALFFVDRVTPPSYRIP
jgi:erythromycin esterase-like protein